MDDLTARRERNHKNVRERDYEIAQLLGVGLTRIQAERELTARRGETLGDGGGSPGTTHPPAA